MGEGHRETGDGWPKRQQRNADQIGREHQTQLDPVAQMQSS